MKKAESGINVITGRKVVKIDAARQEAELDNGRVITYGKCLLATGGKPKVGHKFHKNIYSGKRQVRN